MVSSRIPASRNALLIGGIATCAFAALLLTMKCRSSRSQQQKVNCTSAHNDDEEQVELLDIEKTLYSTDTDATSTITWFAGDFKAASKILQTRLEQVLEANRWLTGRAVKRKGKLLLVYSRSKLVIANVVQQEALHIVPPDKSPVSRNTPLDRLGAKSSAFLVTNGPSQSLFQVTVVPCATRPETYFGVVVSMSHIVADGFTFYSIHNMLLGCTNANSNASNNAEQVPVESLIVKRIPNTMQLQMQAMGKKEYSYLKSAGFIVSNILGAIQSKLCKGARIQSRYVLVDPNAMAQAKQSALLSPPSSSSSASATTTAAEDCVPFISTNDVLTSWFVQQSACPYALMVVNWRDRLPGHTLLHAGNYENVLFYSRTDSSTPVLIRQSLVAKKRIVTQDYMPSFWQRATGATAIVTNWASFAKPNAIHGCEEELHIPLYDIASVLPSTLAMCCIFRAGPQGLALFLAGTKQSLEGLHGASFLLDKIIC